MELFEAVRILILFGIAFATALFLTPFVYKLLLFFDLRKRNIRSAERAPIFNKLHKGKASTPTMGGIIIWATVLGLALLFLLVDNIFGGGASYFNFVDRAETYLPLAALFFAAIIGLLDDLSGVWGKGAHEGGISMSQKILLYTAVAVVAAWWFYFKLGWDTLTVPFIGTFEIGWWYIPFFILVISATAHSTNITDGLDGLAGGVLFFAFAALAVVAFTLGRFDLAAFIAVLLGATLAFLWYNIYPAKFFMGDTGSMSLGVTLGIIAMLTDTALLLPLFAFILVFESLSVIIQTISKKFRGKKIFHSTPIHHHFEALGWPESQITMRFWIISAAVSTIGLVIFFLATFA